MKKSNEVHQYDYNIGFIRVVLTILVLLGHSTLFLGKSFEIVTGDIGTLAVQDSIHFLIYTFHMPAYMIMTGYLYYKFRMQKGISSYKGYFLKLIIIQLVIQAVCETAVLSIEISSGITYVSIEKEFISGWLTNTHSAWYLIAYVIYCIVTYNSYKLCKKHWLLLITFLQLAILPMTVYCDLYEMCVPDICIKLGYYYVWFVVGIWIEKKELYSKLNKLLESPNRMYFVLAFVIIFVAQTFIECLNMQIQTSVCGIFGSLAIYQICVFILNDLRISGYAKIDKFKQSIRKLDSYSFIAYAVGNPVWMIYNYLWLKTFAKFNDGILVWNWSCVFSLTVFGFLFQVVLIYLVKQFADMSKSLCTARDSSKGA